MPESIVETKQQIVSSICSQLGISEFMVGPGSSEPAEFFRAVALSLRIDLAGVSTKPDMGRRIVEYAGLTWDEECDSRGTASGGGSTVTNRGLVRVREAVLLLMNSRSMGNSRALDIRPGVESLLTYRHHGYEIWYAIAELVDNAVSSFRIGKREGRLQGDDPLKVEVIFDKDNRTIVVQDNAGGIEIEKLEDALIAGRAPLDKSDLNQFGMGLKTASFWFGSHLNIETFPVGRRMRIEVDVDLLRMIATGSEVIPIVTQTDAEAHGTRITISGLWPERAIPATKTLTKVREYLASIYRQDLKSGTLILEVGDRRLEAPSQEVLLAARWDLPEEPAIRWEKLIDIDLNGKRVEGVVWLLSRGDTSNAGLVLTWKGKAIVGAGAGANDANDSYRPQIIYGRSNSFVSQRLMGELDMSAFPVTAKKDGLEWTEDEQDSFAKLLRAAIDEEPLPMIKMATMYRKRLKPLDINGDIKTAVSSLIAALTSAGAEDLPPVDLTNPRFDNEPPPTPPPPSSPLAVDVETGAALNQSFVLPMLFPGVRSGVLRVEWDPEDSRVVWWHREEGDLVVIHVNRASRYLENYSALPEFHLEPILRILVALIIAEIQATAEGLLSARRMTAILNEQLSKSLGLPVLAGSDRDE
jgi:hypothetical protein